MRGLSGHLLEQVQKHEIASFSRSAPSLLPSHHATRIYYARRPESHFPLASLRLLNRSPILAYARFTGRIGLLKTDSTPSRLPGASDRSSRLRSPHIHGQEEKNIANLFSRERITNGALAGMQKPFDVSHGMVSRP